MGAVGNRWPTHVASTGGCVMRTYDFSPLYRQTVGFDRLLDMLDHSMEPGNTSPTYPPYNIERTGDNAYRISLAVAGFNSDEISIETKENTLSVKGAKSEETQVNQTTEILYQGIAARSFERRFQLADFVTVTGASLVNGLLHIDLLRELPEEQKPRRIEINVGEPTPRIVQSRAA
jgi:molecular chaperone IbpA